MLVLTLVCLLAPGVSFGGEPGFASLEPDARLVPWNTVTRIALASGKFPPLFRSLTSAELAAYLDLPNDGADPTEQAIASWWQARYQAAGGGLAWTGCQGKKYPYSARVQGRMTAGFSELGDIIPAEAGLAWAGGWNVTFEPVVDWATGPFWAPFSGRATSRIAQGGLELPEGDPLLWPESTIPTGRAIVRKARLSDGAWLLDVPQFLVGAQLGNWSLSAGWAARRTGPGLTGALTQDYSGASYPALTARRTSPFKWSGFMDFIAPDNLLLRSGLLSKRRVSFSDHRGWYAKMARPWFFQWLLGWEVTDWFRTTFTHTVMASAREGTLWPDLIQVNFPLIGTTWRESESGPATDRLFSVQMEFRWRDAPWPLLPAQAGRLFWEYAGTDFLPSGPGGLIPQISIPASVAGFELVSPRWDLGFEFAETFHDKGFWYSNGGYIEGYSQRGWLLGHPMGGGAESLTALVRIRPTSWALRAELKANHTVWDHPRYTNGNGKKSSLSLGIGNRPGRDALSCKSPLLWQVTAELMEEESASGNVPTEGRRWWRLYLKLNI